MLYISSIEAVEHAHIRILVEPTLYISSSEVALHTTGVGLQRWETRSPTHSWCNNLCCTFLPARLLCTPQVLDYEGGKHIAPHTASAIAYAILLFQRGYSAHPQILDYEGKKHTAPHTYNAEAAYAVHFF